ncbi:MAG: AAA family ATPase, partial [Acetobacteraceae bacterium]
MKLRRLELLRYGHLSDLALDFPDAVRLHVVHGANEAGKSTALAAIADALFGFDHRTDFDFMHGSPQLLLGFTLASGDGREARFLRRKGRGNTLRDADGSPVPDDALHQFLGSAGRELFEQRFGLSALRMREGGEELLRVGGALGESMFAGLGILNLRAALGQLDGAAKALVGDGRGQRVLSQAITAWHRAKGEADSLAVLPRDWQAAEAAHRAALAGLAELQARTRTLSKEMARLQRLRRIAPLLAELSDAREKLGEFATAPHLPDDAEARFRELVAKARESSRDAVRESAEKEHLAQDRVALLQDPAALAVQDAIDALAAERSVVQQANTDLIEVEAAVARRRQSVAEAVADLGLALTPEAARDTVPAPAARRAAQHLISRHAALAAERNAADRAATDARLDCNKARLALEAMPPAAASDLLRRSIDSVRSEGPLDSNLARLERALADAARATATALAALPLWSGDLPALAGCPLPLAADQDQATALLDAAAKALDLARGDSRSLAQEIVALEHEMSRLARGEAVPTPDAVAAARERRDRVWRLIRRAHEGGTPASAEERAALPPGPLPELFEQFRDEADRLADRRAEDAQRVADFLAASARRTLLAGRREEVAHRLAGCERASAAAEAKWQALWAQAGLIPGTPAAMSEWRHAREQTLALAATEAELRSQQHELSTRRDAARARLAPLLPQSAAPETLAALLLRAEAACASLEATEKKHESLSKALADAEERLPALEQAMQTAAAGLAEWQRNWGSAVTALGLPEDATIELAESALTAWARIAEAAPAWRTDAQRITDMQATIVGFEARIRAVEASLAEPPADEPAVVIASRFARRLAAARSAADQEAQLTKRMADYAEAEREAIQSRNDAERELESLRALAGVPDDAVLEQAIGRARARDTLARRIAELEAGLLKQGDGMAEEALRAEAMASDPDAAAARLAEIETELSSLGDRREELSAECKTKADALAAMEQGRDAAAKAQDAENALADARDAAERYARLHTARVLLRAGIDRFLRQQQDP